MICSLTLPRAITRPMGLLQSISNWWKRTRSAPFEPSPRNRRTFQDRSAQGERGVATGYGTQPNAINRRKLISGEIGDFVYDGQLMIVHSSNVNAAVYFIDRGKMHVEFHDGSIYEYSSVSEQEAISFATAQSKGIWVWDYLRVRGSRTRHRKPWRKIR